MKMPPPLRNGMYAAYSAAFSRMLSERTPGRATPALGAVLGSAMSGEQRPVLGQQRLGDEPRLQRMRDPGTLEEDRSMIAAKGDPRHPGRQGGERGLPRRQALGPAARGDARQVGGPRDQRVEPRREPRLALVLAGRVDARAERD